MPVAGQQGKDVLRRISELGVLKNAAGDVHFVEFLHRGHRFPDLGPVVTGIRARCAAGIMELGGQYGAGLGQLREDLTVVSADDPVLQALQIEPLLV